mgnify:CR=1 FL=1
MSKQPAPSEWITQAEAARLRKVSRQAISKLVAAGRIRTTTFGGRAFVNRRDVEKFEPEARGRKKAGK